MSFFSSRRQAELPPVPPQTSERNPPVPVSTQQPVGFETVLGANSVVEGHLSSTANVRLDGTFTGTLEITGNVLVGETARITADINARNISIAGAVRGNVSGKKVQILRTGRVWGDIHAQALTTEEGAFLDGKITMTRPDITGEPLAERSGGDFSPEKQEPATVSESAADTESNGSPAPVESQASQTDADIAESSEPDDKGVSGDDELEDR